jgi:outer membrane protein OmpA-like peptidoglycan-associated protein/ABC-type nitrate/sulfonate/bicarbonate transport system substrate-binding protein
MKIKPLPKALAILAIVGGLGYVAMGTNLSAYLKPHTTIAAAVPPAIDLPTSAPTELSTGTTIAAPSVSGESLRVKTLAWNGTAGMAYAKAASLYKAKGLDVDIKRMDMYDQMTAELASFAKNNTEGAHFVVIMGDGYPAFAVGANAALKPFNSSVAAIAGIGYSRGEDKCIIADGADPRGSLIAGVLGDGDINICIKYARDKGIVVNSDPKTYSSTAMNFTGVKEFTEGDQKFIASAAADYKSGGSCEERKDLDSGKTVKVCVNGTATWTPGDTNVFNSLAKLKKSIRVLASTKEYMWQMPALVVGNKEWMAKHPAVVNAFLAATFEGGEKIRNDNAALMVAAAEQAKIIGEQDASYWASLYKGTVETGPNGKQVALGGSTTNGVADAGYLFGLNGADNLFKKVYTVYGNIAVQYFPDIMPGGLQKYEDVVDSSYVQTLLASSTNVTKAVTPTFTGATTETFAGRTVSIEFETGKATFTSKAVTALNDVLDQASVTGLSVQINGHTDNVGDAASNLALSKARAEAVKTFLMTNAPGNFPAERVITRGFGDSQPIADNKTAAGKATNRRVEILLKK